MILNSVINWATIMTILRLLKSTKTLVALKLLLKDKEYFYNEDSFVLIRSIFENHIMNRYVRKHIDIECERQDVIKKFILNPLSVTLNYFSLQGYSIIDNDGNTVGTIPMPNGVKMGDEINYYSSFYQFLCQYTHCSFGALSCYFDDNFFTYRKKNFELLTLLFTLFVFTKIYEGVVTVEGENFDTEKEERSFYNLGYDSLELQLMLFDFLIYYYSSKSEEKIMSAIEKYLGDGNYDKTSKKIIEMLDQMKNSLFDSKIGSLDKSQMKDDKHFARKYPKLGFLNSSR